jgi:acyl-coenzyme A thioesterase PaaI-like protein
MCFGCGNDHPTGLHMSITAGEDLDVRAVFQVTEHHQGAPGIAHGGLLGLAFDEALGATNWLIRASAVTAHLEVSYRLPVPVDSMVYIEASISAVQGRKIWAVATGRLGAVDGPVAVEAASLFIKVGVDHFLKHGRAADIESATSDAFVRGHLANLDIAP